jgi:hypothetical protein
MTLFIIVWCVAATIVGAFVGDYKGRTWTGVLLGFFLGWIGVIITACLPPTQEKRVQRMQRDMHLQDEAKRRYLGQ